MPAQGQTLASLLKALAGRQTRYVNRVEGRSGTLWEGRYKSGPVDTESYLLECSRYIEEPTACRDSGPPGAIPLVQFWCQGRPMGRPPPRSGSLLSGDGRDRAAKAKSLYGVCVRCSTIRADAHSRGLATREASGLLMRSTASSACAWRGEAKGVRQSAKNKSVPFPSFFPPFKNRSVPFLPSLTQPGNLTTQVSALSVTLMKRLVFSSFVACSAVFALLLCCGNTQGDPLTPTAKVTVTTLIRANGTPPDVITLRRNQVFLLRGLSVRAGDSVDVLFTKNGESFHVNTTASPGFPFDLLAGLGIPLKGPATVTISGKGLVAYEIQKI